MMNTNLYVLGVLFLIGLGDSQSCSGYDCLKNYIDRPEPAYKWTDTGARLRGEGGNGVGWTGYLLNFTSQTWLHPELVTRSEWWHNLLIIVPDNVRVLDTATLWIEGVDNTHAEEDIDPNGYNVQFLANVSISQGMISAIVFQVPNQPIVFAEDVLAQEREENALISFTWWHFINDQNHDAEYLIRLPMIKSAVKAMDTITNFLTDDTAPPEIQALGLNPTKFIAGGASKRGWTAWNLATVDSRVIAIYPTIMDLLNYVKLMKHEFASYGGWSYAMSDLWEMNITLYTDTPEMLQLQEILDVYQYPEKMMIPKLVILATNDEFFLPTNTRYWWKDLPQTEDLNRLLMVPNQEHMWFGGLTAKLPVINSWIKQILEDSSTVEINSLSNRDDFVNRLSKSGSIPRYNWTHESGEIIVTSESAPTKVELWWAESCDSKRRDWR